AYIDSAIDYILSLYPATSRPTQVLLLGHSMGGLVALSLLSSQSSATRISAVVTMSSPNSLPPARFDRRVEDLYGQVYRGLYPTHGNYSPPVLSICGGATDSLIPSETCFLPPAPDKYSIGSLYRETVFTTALEGIWTGVGHNEMVWCHQPGEGSSPEDFGLAVEVRELFALASEDDQDKEVWLGLKVDGYVEKGKRGVVAVLEPRQENPSEGAAEKGEANV
ncbi:GPI inositol deacylase, partial [Tulasnella sp. 408]